MINITRPEREAKEREIVEMRVPMHRMLASEKSLYKIEPRRKKYC